MNSLSNIPITVEASTDTDDIGASGNIPLLLIELQHALLRLAADGETRTIDLRALPLAPGEPEALEQMLGRGEVHAQLDALGPSEIIETRFPGIWRITHYNQNREIMGSFLEVTTLPQLLQTPSEELQTSARELQELIKNPQNYSPPSQ